MTTIDNGRTRQYFFLSILIGMGILIFMHLYPFINAVLGALTFYILFRRFMVYLVEKRKWKRSLAAFLIIGFSFLIILLPVWALVNLLSKKVISMMQNSDAWVGEIKAFGEQLHQEYGIDILQGENFQSLQSKLAARVPDFLVGTIDALTIIALMYFLLYFMLYRTREMEVWLYEYVPLKDANVIKLGNEINGMVLSNAIGIPLLAIIQGLSALLAYALLGVPEPVLWAVVTAFASMLPVIGSTAVWFPLSVYLFLNGMEWQGMTLWAYGVLIIINIDNLFRIVLQRRLADVHPVVTMLGVIIGISLFGFIGLVFGPLIISMFILLFNIYRDEFLEKKRQSNHRHHQPD